jgi:hypothetical protein
MAFSVRIAGYSKDTGAEVYMLEPCWWDDRELMEDDRFTETSLNPGYLDYWARLSIVEMREIHEKYKNASKIGIYGSDDWQKRITPKIKELDDILYKRFNYYSDFVVTVFEWESGY